MYLRELCQQYGVARNIDLSRVLEITPQHSWQLWHGERRIVPELAIKLSEVKGIPLKDILLADPGPRWQGKQARQRESYAARQQERTQEMASVSS